MICKVFEIEGFGTVGAANLWQAGFVTTNGKHFDDLEVGESCDGTTNVSLREFQKTKELLRVTRLQDKTCI